MSANKITTDSLSLYILLTIKHIQKCNGGVRNRDNKEHQQIEGERNVGECYIFQYWFLFHVVLLYNKLKNEN